MRTILAVDDSRDDLLLLERTLSVAGVEHRLLTAGDGVEAEELLEGIEEGSNSTFPSFVFLDVNMPRRNGFAFLDWFKSKPRCARIPVVMLSSFDDPSEMDKALALGAAGCLQKPPAARAVQRLLQTLTDRSSGRDQPSSTEQRG